MFNTIQSKKFSESIFAMDGISKISVENHLKLYEGYIKKYNEIQEKLKAVDLAAGNQVYSEIRELKLELSFAIGGVKHHEIYFEHLGGKGGQPKGKMEKILADNFGSYENWVSDLKATALSARGWVWLAYDWRFKTWQNYLGDSQNTYPIWESSVALALDTYEHAYWADFGTNRAGYIEAFLKNLDWEVIEKNVTNWNIG